MNVILHNILENKVFTREKIVELDLSHRGLKSLPDLSMYPYLKILNISYNQLTSLDGLPDTIEELNCSSNYITTLPFIPKIRKLDCFLNSIQFLPNEFPETLEWFNGMNNFLEILPINMPPNLHYFNCGNNLITFLPTFKEGLEYIDYSYNFLEKEPILPLSVKTIYSKNAMQLKKT